MRLEIARIQRLLGVATVYVTHDQIEAMTMGDRVAVMRGGKLQQCDTPQDLYDHPRNEFVAGFMGSPPMNLLRVGLESNANGVALMLGSQRLDVPTSYHNSHDLPSIDGPGVIFGVRPEDVEVLDGSSTGSITTRVERREALGAEILVHLSMVDAKGDNAVVVNDSGVVVARPTRLVAKMGPRSGVAVGDHLEVHLNAAHFHFFDADTGLSLRKSS
jgi:multiple sugar transport system ATP-binding protein